MKAKTNDKVKVHYTGKLESGEVFDSSVGKEPLAFTVGDKNLIPAFSNAVSGMEVSEKKSIEVPADEAYGPYRKELVQQVKRTDLPEDIHPEVGQMLVATNERNEQIPVKIVEVTNELITMDANHQLAGKDLVFDIELVEVLEDS